jgi:hypothetical protein
MGAPNYETFGLQEFFITDVETEIIGNNVRVICGVRRGGEVHWLYSCVFPADLMLIANRKCFEAAKQAFCSEDLRALAH